MSFTGGREELTFFPALCYNIFDNETTEGRRLTEREARGGTDPGVFADRLGSSRFA